ncbi:hypothetical protein ACS0TY_012937 [Phlomoides rotata]
MVFYLYIYIYIYMAHKSPSKLLFLEAHILHKQSFGPGHSLIFTLTTIFWQRRIRSKQLGTGSSISIVDVSWFFFLRIHHHSDVCINTTRPTMGNPDFEHDGFFREVRIIFLYNNKKNYYFLAQSLLN